MALSLEASLAPTSSAGSALDLREAVVASFLAPSGALALASWLRAALALLNSTDDVSGAAVASLLAPSGALALASWDR